MTQGGRRTRFWPVASIWGALGVGLLLVSAGCNRAHYRCQADQEVYTAVGCATSDPRWELDDFTIQPNPASRIYDPDNADCPPMPPDDPESHQLMHCVDGMKGWKYWHRNGDTPYVENPMWRAYLPRDAEGVLTLDRQGAMQLALLDSRDYQSELEQLYLSALTVTFQRFRFDTQFFGSTGADYRTVTTRPGESLSTLTHEAGASAQRMFATGAQLTVELANSIVWTFSGHDVRQSTTLLSYQLTQPLLRLAGREVVLEGLTDAERAMLANIRQWEQYRRGFYTRIVAGRGTGPGPSQSGFSIGGLTPSAPVGLGGFLGLLGQQIRIRNQNVNVTVVQTNLDQLEAFFEANRLSGGRLQVEQARQGLLDAQSSLLQLQTDYQNRLDAFKIVLGLPPDLELRIADPLLDRFDLIAPTLTAAQGRVSALLTELRQKDRPIGEQTMKELLSVSSAIGPELAKVQDDLRKLTESLPARRKNLALLAEWPEVRSGTVYPAAFDVQALDARVVKLESDYQRLAALFQATFKALDHAVTRVRSGEKPAKKPDADAPEDPRKELTDVVEDISDQILQLSLVQAAARLDAVPLTWVDLRSDEAYEIARANRPDWMNARASLVDTWRQIEVTANALKAGLSVTVNGNVRSDGTTNPLNGSVTNDLSVGVQFDAPLTRLVERNAYRTALINYQQARRDYMAFEDNINQILRGEIRDIRFNQIDFEMRRAAVFVAIMQLDLTRLNLQRPPKAGETSQLGATTARDLLTASSALLSAQNSFLTGWLNYEIQRMNLDLDLGTMRLDENGMWIDPGPIQSGHGVMGSPSATAAEDIPPPAPAATL